MGACVRLICWRMSFREGLGGAWLLGAESLRNANPNSGLSLPFRLSKMPHHGASTGSQLKDGLRAIGLATKFVHVVRWPRSTRRGLTSR